MASANAPADDSPPSQTPSAHPRLKLCFAGTPAFAAAHLSALLEAGHEVSAVFTQPDRPAGRGRKPRPSAVAELAVAHGLPLHKPADLRGGEAIPLLASHQPDALIVAAYGLILPPSILTLPRHGCVNVHASLLPRWRGAAPIERALLAGEKNTGISIMRMDEGLDTGPILCQREVAIAKEDDRETLEAKLTETGRGALLRSLQGLPELLANARRQDDAKATYAHKLEKTEARIDWTADAVFIARQVRAGIGRAPAFTFAGQRRIRILRATAEPRERAAAPGQIVAAGKRGLLVACGTGALCIAVLQLPGKNPAPTRALTQSPFAPGGYFSGEPQRAS